MEKGMITVVLVFLVIVAGVVVTIFLVLPDGINNLGDGDTDDLPPLPITPGQQKEYIENLDYERCEILSYNSRENYCVQQIAILKNDISTCDSIQSEKKKQYCMNGVAIAHEDESHCASVSTGKEQDYCYTGHAYTFNDISYCGKIVDEDFRDACYYYLAQYNTEPEICENMEPTTVNENGGISNSLTDSCYEDIFNLIEFEHTLSDCDKIISQRSKNDCLINYAVENKDISICDQVDPNFGLNTGTDQEWCISQVASAMIDGSLCEEISSSEMKQSCNKAIVSASGDLDGCDQFENTQKLTKESCISGVAATNQDPSVCELLTVGDKGNCYKAIAGYTARLYRYGEDIEIDVSTCELIPEDSYSTPDDCYFIVAAYSLDSSYCDFASTLEFKEKCQMFISLENEMSLTYCGSLTTDEAINDCYRTVIWEQRAYGAASQIL